MDIDEGIEIPAEKVRKQLCAISLAIQLIEHHYNSNTCKYLMK